MVAKIVSVRLSCSGKSSVSLPELPTVIPRHGLPGAFVVSHDGREECTSG